MLMQDTSIFLGLRIKPSQVGDFCFHYDDARKIYNIGILHRIAFVQRSNTCSRVLGSVYFSAKMDKINYSLFFSQIFLPFSLYRTELYTNPMNRLKGAVRYLATKKSRCVTTADLKTLPLFSTSAAHMSNKQVDIWPSSKKNALHFFGAEMIFSVKRHDGKKNKGAAPSLNA